MNQHRGCCHGHHIHVCHRVRFGHVARPAPARARAPVNKRKMVAVVRDPKHVAALVNAQKLRDAVVVLQGYEKNKGHRRGRDDAAAQSYWWMRCRDQRSDQDTMRKKVQAYLASVHATFAVWEPTSAIVGNILLWPECMTFRIPPRKDGRPITNEDLKQAQRRAANVPEGTSFLRLLDPKAYRKTIGDLVKTATSDAQIIMAKLDKLAIELVIRKNAKPRC